MIAADLINDSIPYLENSTLASKALDWMEEYRLSQMPVIKKENLKYIGLVDESVLLDLANPEATIIKEILLDHKNTYINPETHLYSILGLQGEHKIDILPVLDENMAFQGSITYREIQQAIQKMFASQRLGGIIIVTTDAVNYSMQELSRLIESNNVKVQSSFVEIDPDSSEKLNITFKLDTMDLSFVIATLERFGYFVKGKFDDTVKNNYEQERIDLLLKYLEI